MGRDWHGWAIHLVTQRHDPYAVLYRWPLSLTLDVFVHLQLEGALTQERYDSADRS